MQRLVTMRVSRAVFLFNVAQNHGYFNQSEGSDGQSDGHSDENKSGVMA